MEYKSPLIIGLEIDEFSPESGVDVISLVEQPAIESDFRWFKSQFESYSDYPDAVSNNAKKGIELNDKVGNKCATQIGKLRGQQLANKEKISVETIQRMYSYLARAEEYYDENDTEACGTISFLLWGGLAGKRWSESKLKELGLFEGKQFVENAGGFSIGDYVSWTYAGRSEEDDRGRGQIKDLRVSGKLKVPDTDFELSPTEDRPAALIETIDGTIIGQYTDNLRKIQKPDGFTDEEIFEMVLEDIIKQKYINDLPEDVQDKLLNALELVGEKESDLEKEGWVLMKEEQMFAISSKPDLPSIEDYGMTADGKTAFKIRYKYTGPKDTNTRAFCSRMLSAGLVYRKEDINKLTISGENSEFGIYDIFTYKGSYGCRHYWTRLVYQNVNGEVNETEQVSVDTATSVNPLPTMNRNPNSSSLTQTFAEQSGDKMLISGPLMIPSKLIYRWDEQMGEYWVYFSKDTIQKIAYKFAMDKNQRNTNLEHSEEMKMDDIILVESWLVENPEKDKSYELMGKTYEKGTWFGVFKCLNMGVWQDWVKNSRVKGFSVEGYFADKIINKFQKHRFYYRTTDGGTEIVIDERTFVVFILKDGERNAVMPDGTYELTNGKKLVVIDSKAVEGSF